MTLIKHTVLALVASIATAAELANTCSNSAQDATVFAVTYSYPVAAYRKLAAPILPVLGANRLNSGRELSGPANQAVVRPNADTLYTTMLVDLSHSDLVLTVPPINDGRYWVYPFYDFFGNNFAFISITHNSPPGDYLIRRADDALVEPGITYNKASTASPYKGIVSFPTTYGTLLGRILVLQNTTADLDIVHGYQDATKVAIIKRRSHQPQTPQAPALTSALLNSTASSSVVASLDILASLGVYNQPEVYSNRYTVASTLGQAGLANGQYCTPAGVNISQAVATSAVNIRTTTAKHVINLGHGWQIGTKPYSGDFGTNYDGRAAIAINGYLQLVQSQAIYPSSVNSTVTLSPNKALLFTFSRRPPIKKSGFWSLTAYNAGQYLIPNSINRYEIGDRNLDLKFENGGLVNGNGTDGKFQVLLQQADVAPPSNWTSNWLPAPAGGGTLSYTLRFYVPAPAFTNGSYIYPIVELIDAITA